MHKQGDRVKVTLTLEDEVVVVDDKGTYLSNGITLYNDGSAYFPDPAHNPKTTLIEVIRTPLPTAVGAVVRRMSIAGAALYTRCDDGYWMKIKDGHGLDRTISSFRMENYNEAGMVEVLFKGVSD